MTLITLLSLAGLVISIVAQQKRSFAAAQEGCDDQSCETVQRQPQAVLFAGLPNSILGIVWYSILLAWSFPAAYFVLPSWLGTSITLAAAIAASVSLYLGVMLFFVLKLPCTLCYAAHAVNLCILVILLVSL